MKNKAEKDIERIKKHRPWNHKQRQRRIWWTEHLTHLKWVKKSFWYLGWSYYLYSLVFLSFIDIGFAIIVWSLIICQSWQVPPSLRFPSHQEGKLLSSLRQVHIS